MKRSILAAVATAVALSLSAPAYANYDAARAQLIRSVERELPRYVQGVDLSQLSNAKLAEIKAALHGPGSRGDKQAKIKSILGGSYSLRGLLFN
ncbi:hypothetical protein [Psychromarinibacter sp. S121]|uniref:hypothetical protein n=1 Tax=Psychromarinibacter sp. S121 TaxID=3415127 RepID=UPI003C7EC9A2